MKECRPLTNTQFDVMMKNFKDYMVLGGMPAIVSKYIKNKNFSGILSMQEQILKDYEIQPGLEKGNFPGSGLAVFICL